MSRAILIMAGGTGGHVFPGLAVAEFFRQQGWRVVWLGTHAGMEAKLVVQQGYEMAWVSFSGVRGKSALRFLLLPMKLLVAFWQSARAIFKYRPDVVLGMGGYVAFPGGMMASLLNRPLVIHEQNSIAGLANKILAKLADRVLVAFPEAFGAATTGIQIVTGNPVRSEILTIEPPETRYSKRTGPLHVLVVGGSLGAQVLNETVPQALALLPREARPLVTHQSGAQHFAALKEGYARAGVEARVEAFIADMAHCYAESDLLICRAGALTVAEIAVAGIASILVPYPLAADDHQTHNARHLSDQGAAWILQQSDLSARSLADLLRGINRENLLQVARRARQLGKPDATQLVARSCMELAYAG
ncbi:MAG TPA: undecaprenyldiphospho-muramoylpentapeptide beta-N-acetylglucosaminyltransferase [Burkholderiales bacterium]|nr:undecaprenyldiphospho-muramoylpentapeptide beta-N-acetylglucosaminyltransferase [Burkholderiales bacterium]